MVIVLATDGSDSSLRAAGAALVVVGRRGLSGLQEVVLGSVSSAVLHRAPCPVLVIR